jgi:MarR family multiple antibiotic resistance transcriptional regulator
MENKTLFRDLFESMSKCKRLMHHSFSSLTKDLEATMIQAQALMFIKEHPDSTVGELARTLYISMSSSAQLADRLAKQSWITRRGDKKDRRIVRLRLTRSGEQELRNFYEQMVERMAEFYGHIPVKDVRELLRIHNELIHRVESNHT